MGTVIRFPEATPGASDMRASGSSEPATVIILPVIRIERYSDDPSDDYEQSSKPRQRRGRRRRASRS